MSGKTTACDGLENRLGSCLAWGRDGEEQLHTEGMLSLCSDLTGTCRTCQLISIVSNQILMSKLARNMTWCLSMEPLCLAPPAALGRAQQERFLVEKGGIAVEGPWSDPSHPPARGRAASSPDGLHRRTFPVLPCQRPLCRRAERQHSCLPSPAKPAPVRPSLSLELPSVNSPSSRRSKAAAMGSRQQARGDKRLWATRT